MKITLASATSFVLAIAIAAPALADSITCESLDGRERYCGANTRGGVYLSTQLSSRGCFQGDTWGYDRNGIWVTGGCRAVFQTGGSWGGNNYYHGNDYYSGDRNNRKNDGATAAIAIGAILGAAVIASAASKNKHSNDSDYGSAYDNGCSTGRSDRSKGESRDYTRHYGRYDGRSEQAFSSGYNQCWSR